jgi:pSer/pThr/pTyr-binding forkhead associated (FHA) protein
VIRQGGSITVRDLGSTNGTFVNGRKVDGEIVVSQGDEVQFGAVKFRLEG